MHSPKEMLSPRLREALPKAKGCSPQGRDMHAPRDALPEELSLPTTEAQSSSHQLCGRGRGLAAGSPQEVLQSCGARLGSWGWPRSPACCQPCHVHAAHVPSAPPGCPLPLAHCFWMHLAPPAPEPHRDITIHALTPPSSHSRWGPFSGASKAPFEVP